MEKEIQRKIVIVLEKHKTVFKYRNYLKKCHQYTSKTT